MSPRFHALVAIALLFTMILPAAPPANAEEPAPGAAETAAPAKDSAAATPTPTVPEGWSEVAVIPWGTGPAKLVQEMDSKDERQTYQGPTRFLVFPDGRFAVLDVLGSAVEEFDKTGKHVRELTFPANDQHDSETLTIDMASSGPGEYWLLSLGQRAVLHLKAGAALKSYPISGLTPDALLNGLASDGQGGLYVLDSNDNSVIPISTAGKCKPRIANDVAQSLTVDGKGRFYGLALANNSDARHWKLVRWTPPANVETLGQFETPLEANQLDLFGLDEAQNVYACLASGAIENPTTVEIVRFGPDGKINGRTPSPLDPSRLHFMHGKAVTPDGTLFAVMVSDKGLVVLKHDKL
jgi:hypothetical protein